MGKGTRAAALAGALATAALVAGGLARGGAQSDGTPELRLNVTAVAIVTERYPEMLAFYRDAMGFEVEALDEANDYAMFVNEGVHFHLTTSATMKGASGAARFDEPRSGQSFELAFEVPRPEDVDRVYARLVAAGATPVLAPEDKPWRQRMAFFADPDGNVHDVFCRL